MPALTAYLTSTNDTLVTTARQLTNSAPASETSVTNKTGKSLNWDDLDSQGDTGAWTAGASEPAFGAGATGFIWDVTTLEGQQIVAGTWSFTVKLSTSSGTVTADVHVRAGVRSSGGVFTQIIDLVSAGASITATAATFTGSGSGGLTNFNTGDKLWIEVLLNITANSSTSLTATTALFENGGASESVVTPGYQVQPAAALVPPPQPYFDVFKVPGGIAYSQTLRLVPVGSPAALVPPPPPYPDWFKPWLHSSFYQALPQAPVGNPPALLAVQPFYSDFFKPGPTLPYYQAPSRLVPVGPPAAMVPPVAFYPAFYASILSAACYQRLPVAIQLAVVVGGKPTRTLMGAGL